MKVLATSDPPDYDQPWQTRGVENATGSGAIIDRVAGLHVLTNAHVVENAVFIELRRYGHARKYVAEVEGIGHECDLALLKVEKQELFRGTIAFSIGTQVSTGVFVIGEWCPDPLRTSRRDRRLFLPAGWRAWISPAAPGVLCSAEDHRHRRLRE